MEALRVVDGERIEIRQPRFKLLPFNELHPRGEPAYLVKGLIPRAGLTLVWGPPKSGKSFWTFDLMTSVARGQPYRGRKVQGGPVLYCAFEGAAGLGKRAEAIRVRRGTRSEIVPLYVLGARIDLVHEHPDLISAVRTTLGSSSPVAVVLDTLNRSLVGSESADADMAAYIAATDAIREAFNCAVVVVHHCGVDGTRPRGHTSLTGAVDAQLAVKRDEANNVIVTVEWMKDGPEGEAVFSRLESVEVGRDSDGDAITSCVVVEETGTVEAAGKRAKRKAGAAETALRALGEAIDQTGIPAPASDHIPANVKVVTIDEWRAACYSRGISTSSAARAKQQAFKRASEYLIGSGAVGIWNDLVWISRDHE